MFYRNWFKTGIIKNVFGAKGSQIRLPEVTNDDDDEDIVLDSEESRALKPLNSLKKLTNSIFNTILPENYNSMSDQERLNAIEKVLTKVLFNQVFIIGIMIMCLLHLFFNRK